MQKIKLWKIDGFLLKMWKLYGAELEPMHIAINCVKVISWFFLFLSLWKMGIFLSREIIRMDKKQRQTKIYLVLFDKFRWFVIYERLFFLLSVAFPRLQWFWISYIWVICLFASFSSLFGSLLFCIFFVFVFEWQRCKRFHEQMRFSFFKLAVMVAVQFHTLTPNNNFKSWCLLFFFPLSLYLSRLLYFHSFWS